MDTVRAAEANGLKVPKEFDDPETRATLENAICHEWLVPCPPPLANLVALARSASVAPLGLTMCFHSLPLPSPSPCRFSGYATSSEFRTLAMGRLLSDLSSSLATSVSGSSSSPKLLVSATHDTTLAGMLATLGVFDHKWPDFTAQVSVELFKGTGDEGKSWTEWASGKLGRLTSKQGKTKEASHCTAVSASFLFLSLSLSLSRSPAQCSRSGPLRADDLVPRAAPRPAPPGQTSASGTTTGRSLSRRAPSKVATSKARPSSARLTPSARRSRR